MVRISDWLKNIRWCRTDEEPKTYLDVNGNEYDTNKYDFVKDWEIRRVMHNLENHNKAKVAFGDELREVSKEKLAEQQAEEKKEEARMKELAKHEAEILFDYLKVEFKSRAKWGRFSWYCDLAKFEAIMKAKNLHSDVDYIYEELTKICKRNKIRTYTEFDWDKITIYYFNWE